MVDTAEHALRLWRYLPEFYVVHAGIGTRQWELFVNRGLVRADECFLQKPEVLTCQEKFAKGRLTRVISTMVWREGVDFPELDAVLRADGSPGPIPSTQITGRLSRIGDGIKETGILVDFTDEFGPRFEGRADSRRRVYTSHGWKNTTWLPK